MTFIYTLLSRAFKMCVLYVTNIVIKANKKVPKHSELV